jgi:pimeloyl-ACP methyl ester carboxylesterase
MHHFVSTDAEIAYSVSGKGAPLVLLHPFPVNSHFWSRMAVRLESRYRLLKPDLRGHGDSGVGEGPITMAKHAADVARLLDIEHVSRAAFVGVSIGGYILFEFWRRYRDRVAALALCDTRASADTAEGRANRLKSAEDVERHGPAPFIENMVPKLLGETTRRNRPDLVEEARSMMRRMSVQGIVQLQRGMAERPDSMPTLPSVDGPVLVLVGAEDTLTPPADAEVMHAGIRGSQFNVVAAAGHFAPFEQPEECARILRNFLDPLELS